MTCDTLLLRQVNPSWISKGRVTSQAFKPTVKDQGKLSVYDGDQISAQEAYCHYTQEQRLKSAGVLALSVAECRNQDLSVKPDPEPFPEHVVVDFSGLSNSQINSRAKHLRSAAKHRGWLFRMDTT